MSSLNIFKIYEAQVDGHVEFLQEKGYHQHELNDVDEEGVVVQYELFFTRPGIAREVKWVSQIREMFEVDIQDKLDYAAVVLISWPGCTYAVSYGVSHFFVSRFSNLDFGLEIAARVVDKFLLKNTRDFGGARIKSLETYQTIPALPLEAGEAVQMLRGIPADTDLWGKTISCGQSVKVNIKDISIADAGNICRNLESALLLEPRFSIPTTKRVMSQTDIERLMTLLKEDIISEKLLVNISQQQLSGVAFIFPEAEELILKYRTKELTLQPSMEFSQILTASMDTFDDDLDKLLRSRVIAMVDGETLYDKRLLNFLEYINDEESVYLENGRWFRYENSYISRIDDAVDQLNFDEINEMRLLKNSHYEAWKKDNEELKKNYRERYVNTHLHEEYEYNDIDTELVRVEGHSIEAADLLKDDTLYVVKIGTPQKLSYAIDQANSTVAYLSQRNNSIQFKGQNVHIKNVCIWFFLERATTVDRLSEIKSIIFKMKLAHWRKNAFVSHLIPRVRLSYFHRES